jgi:site-specific recombinase XerD
MKDKVPDHTINGRIRALKTFFKFLVSDGLWEGKPNPLEKISFVKTDKKIKPVLSIEQVEQLLRIPNKKTFTGFRNLRSRQRLPYIFYFVEAFRFGLI